MSATSLLFVILGVFTLFIGIYFHLLKYFEKKKKETAEKRRRFVLENSRIVNEVDVLNKNYSFYSIDSHASITRECNSKKEFERFDLDLFFRKLVHEQYDYYQILINEVEKNRALYQEYEQKFDGIVSSESPNGSELYDEYPFFRKIEMEACSQRKQLPVTAPEIVVKKEYISPQGRMHYQEDKCFDYSAIKECFETVGDLPDDEDIDPQYERSLMTDSMRYDILKRDGFRCVLCGASAKDGAKLHVDHIFPVSKGGKTEPDNLRTLCESCNRGKGAKYDFNGIN